MNTIEGQISIDLYSQKKPDMARPESVNIESSRPVEASNILIGKTPEKVLSIIPLLFNICGIAQSRAALLAIEKKLKKDKEPALEAARDLLVLAENAREHLLRIFLDWPRLFDLKVKDIDLTYPARLSKSFTIALFDQGEAFLLNSKLNNDLGNIPQLIDQLDDFLVKNIFHSPLEEWLMLQNKSLQNWADMTNSLAAKTVDTIYRENWAIQGYSDCLSLPELDDNDLLAQFNSTQAEKFIARPEWQGNNFETTTLSRQFEQPLIQDLHEEYSSGLITRWIARLTELAMIPAQMRQGLKHLRSIDISCKETRSSATPGIAQVEAARGRLIHRVEIENGLISQYQILAPTEWNFHPEGILTQSLANLSANDNQHLEHLSHLFINVVDPCVGYQLKVH